MSEKINKTQVLDRIKGYYKLKSNAKLALFLGVAPTTVSSWYSRATFDIDILYSKCVDLSFDWLLTGEGPMLRDSKNPEETTVGVPPNATPISPTEESLIYKMYKEKDAEVGTLKEEIGALKLRIHQLESQDKEPGHPPVIDKVTETFTSDSSGDYGEGFSLTKKPTSSKKLSAGKM